MRNFYLKKLDNIFYNTVAEYIISYLEHRDHYNVSIVWNALALSVSLCKTVGMPRTKQICRALNSLSKSSFLALPCLDHTSRQQLHETNTLSLLIHQGRATECSNICNSCCQAASLRHIWSWDYVASEKVWSLVTHAAMISKRHVLLYSTKHH